jgi:AbrB family looped-hinge helix DNA binding protein
LPVYIRSPSSASSAFNSQTGLTSGGTVLPLTVKVGKKGYIILPKSVREALNISEGDKLIVEIKDGIVLKPLKKVDVSELRRRYEEHKRKLKELGLKPPKAYEGSLEDEFE